MREARHPLTGQARYDYDPTGRLDAVLRGATAQGGQPQAEHYAYDPAGNLIEAAQLERRGYVRDNRIRVFEDKRYAYDGFGRLIEKRSGKHTLQRFAWDDEDRLVSVTTTRRPNTAQATTQTTHFDYDALGRRVAKSDAFGCTDFIWEGMRLIEERRGSNAIAYVYEPGSYVPLARVDASGVEEPAVAANDIADANANKPRTSTTRQGAGDEEPRGRAHAEGDNSALGTEDEESGARVYYFHTDPSGLPEELSDEAGRIRWRAAYRAWGNTLQESWEAVDLDGRPLALDESEPIPIEQNVRFQGQYLDRETGLHYNTFRYYDPDVGRFISPDPIGVLGGSNLYEYGPNPVGWIDPWGLVNLNTNTATGDFGVYQIEVNGKLYKFGKADLSRVTQSSGQPTRLHQQVRKLQDIHGKRNVVGTVLETGYKTTVEAKGAETARLEQHYKRTGTIPEGNRRSFKPKGKCG